jgi:toxin ParE1/3/4
MSRYKLTSKTKADLTSIRSYTISRWGPTQCLAYLAELRACFQRLAETPALGRSCDDLRPGLLRWEQGRHVVFFRRATYGIRVIRVLHERMLPGRHDLDDEVVD